MNGALGKVRTCDPRFRRPVLFQLSYECTKYVLSFVASETRSEKPVSKTVERQMRNALNGISNQAELTAELRVHDLKEQRKNKKAKRRIYHHYKIHSCTFTSSCTMTKSSVIIEKSQIVQNFLHFHESLYTQKMISKKILLVLPFLLFSCNNDSGIPTQKITPSQTSEKIDTRILLTSRIPSLTFSKTNSIDYIADKNIEPTVADNGLMVIFSGKFTYKNNVIQMQGYLRPKRNITREAFEKLFP